MTAWQSLTPAEVLAAFPALNLNQVAYVLGLSRRDGTVNRAAAVDLVKAGRLPLVDPSQTNARWTVSAGNVSAYIDGKPSLRAAS